MAGTRGRSVTTCASLLLTPRGKLCFASLSWSPVDLLSTTLIGCLNPICLSYLMDLAPLVVGEISARSSLVCCAHFSLSPLPDSELFVPTGVPFVLQQIVAIGDVCRCACLHAVLQERREKQFFGGMFVPSAILQSVLHNYNNSPILQPHDRLVSCHLTPLDGCYELGVQVASLISNRDVRVRPSVS